MGFMSEGAARLADVCGLGLSFNVSGFGLVHVLLAGGMWITAVIYSRREERQMGHKGRYYASLALTLCAVAGVFLAGDLFTVFLFFELMSLASYVWVVQDERKESMRAGAVYLAVAVTGGLVLLMGLFLLYYLAGTLQFTMLRDSLMRNMVEDVWHIGPLESERLVFAAGVCLLVGFGAKAGAFGVHIWLADSYTCAPASGSALLSGMLSKTGIYGILVVTCRIFLGNSSFGMLLLAVGVLTMAAGSVQALFSVNLKRTLAWSSMSQMGFLITGIGMCALLGRDGMTAVRGTLLHMVNHSLFKLVLFLLAGLIGVRAGTMELNRLKGYGRRKPLLHFAFLMSALGIAGVPLWNGYIGKTLLHESILEGIQANRGAGGFLVWTERIFLIAGGCTLAYMAKLYVAIFLEKNEDAGIQERYDTAESGMRSPAGIILIGLSAAFPVMGSLPGVIEDSLADVMGGSFGMEPLAHSIRYFTVGNLKGAAISIGIGVILYVLVVRVCLMKTTVDGRKRYYNYWPAWWNLDKLVYRPLFLHILPGVMGLLARTADSAVDGVIVFIRRHILKDAYLPHEWEEGTWFTNHAGGAADVLVKGYAAVSRRKREEKVSYKHKFAMWREILVENNYIIARSLSFGLILFCAGLCVTLIYLLMK